MVICLNIVQVKCRTKIWASFNSYVDQNIPNLSLYVLHKVQYHSASLSINLAFRAGACTDCEYIECTIAIIIIVILVRSLCLVY